MGRTGVYWKSPFAALARAGMLAWVVNARHVKTVPGRKTDIADAQWRAILARAGLLRGAFIPLVELPTGDGSLASGRIWAACWLRRRIFSTRSSAMPAFDRMA